MRHVARIKKRERVRLLADENFPRLVVQELRSRGHDLVWISEETPGISDREVLARATTEGRILITFDKEDFGELIFRDKQKAPFGVILFRIQQDIPNRTQTIVTALESRSSWAGYFSTVRDEDDIRPRPLPNP